MTKENPFTKRNDKLYWSCIGVKLRLGISAFAIVPLVLSSLILSPILGLIYSPLSLMITLIGGIYSILGIAIYYIYVNFLISGITDLDSILDLIN